MNILAVDDHKDTLEAISDYCYMQSIECETASDGRQGLSKIQDKEYDLILLDMAMPDYSGIDVLNQLKRQGVCDKNIVVMTATCLKKKDFDDYSELGVKQVLPKPTELSQIDKVITKYESSQKAYPIGV